MRPAFGLILLALAAILLACSWIARKSGKEMGGAAAIMTACTSVPVLGNAVLIFTGRELIATLGLYAYFLGMDLVIAACLHFTFTYCRTSWPRVSSRNLVYGLLLVDVVQLLLNPVFHHAFDVRPIEVYGYAYYQLVPHLGQTFHRLVDYGILAGIMGVYVHRLAKAPRLQSERYSVILISMVLVTIWETLYIFSGTPIDRGMIGIAVMSLMLFYFSLYYRPMRLLDRMLGGVVAQQPFAQFFFDVNEKCLWMNPAGEKLLNLGEQDLDKVGDTLRMTFGVRHVGEKEWTDQVIMDGEDGERTCELSKHPFLDKRGRYNGFYITVRDETEERREMTRKLYNARHDHLTGLYNSDYLYECTRRVLEGNADREYLIIYADIKDFKMVNDIYGYTFGDLVLTSTADWISKDLSENCICGRLGGDTFGIVIPADEFDQEAVEKKLADFVVNDGKTEHRLLIHIGVYRVTDRDTEVSVMFDRAHMALTTIKEEYHVITAWYQESMREQVLWNQKISAELKEAIATGQIRPWLQPIVNREGKAIGAEALVRWVHPAEGIRSPDSFIPVFEQNGMIADVDLYIWRCSCKILARWKREGNGQFISVNISPKDFLFLDVAGELKRMVREYGIEPKKLRIEITETVMMSDMEKRMAVLKELQEYGFIIEMDDFGSGYSSLNMLKDMPVDVLKIDMAFLRKSGSTVRARAIIREIIALAQALGIVSLTEGVETEEQYGQLMEMGCQLYQGYFFAKPMPEADYENKFCTAG